MTVPQAIALPEKTPSRVRGNRVIDTRSGKQTCYLLSIDPIGHENWDIG
jgi:hypothetical protein